MRKVDGSEALERSRRLRRDMTPQEKLLWARLRSRRLEGSKFKRQEWVGPYIVDFYCWEAKLIVEVDGSQHQRESHYDAERDAFLTRKGFRILRFWNNEVVEEMEGVLDRIRSALSERLPSPCRRALSAGSLPLPQWEKGR